MKLLDNAQFGQEIQPTQTLAGNSRCFSNWFAIWGTCRYIHVILQPRHDYRN